MDKIKLALNLRKPGNYAFYCPVSNLHLTVSNPIGFSDRVTPSILRGLKIKTILDVNEVIDTKTGLIKQQVPQNAPVASESNENTQSEQVNVENNEPVKTPDNTVETPIQNVEPEPVNSEPVNNSDETEIPVETETPVETEIPVETPINITEVPTEDLTEAPLSTDETEIPVENPVNETETPVETETSEEQISTKKRGRKKKDTE